jgi:hypothetical protein
MSGSYKVITNVLSLAAILSLVVQRSAIELLFVCLHLCTVFPSLFVSNGGYPLYSLQFQFSPHCGGM